MSATDAVNNFIGSFTSTGNDEYDKMLKEQQRMTMENARFTLASTEFGNRQKAIETLCRNCAMG